MRETGLDSVLLEYAQDLLLVLDEDGRLRYASGAAERMLGYAPGALTGRDAFEFVHPEHEERVRGCFEQVIAQDEPTTETVRYRVRTADGDYRWHESRFSNLTDEEIGGYVVSSRDISEQVAAERERADAQEKLSTIASTVGDVLWMFSADWTELRFVNPAYEEVFGASREELEANPSTFLEAIHPEDRDCVREAMARASAGESIELEYRVNPDRDYGRWVWVQAEPIVEDGEVVRIVGFARDITDRRRRERQLAVMDNLLRHNLRNDLSIIIGNAELIAQKGEEPGGERAEIIRNQGMDLVRSAEKQREIIELLTTRTVPESIDVVRLVRNAVDAVRERHPAASIELDLPDSSTALGLYELELAVEELLENAILHDDSGDPTVTITVQQEGEAIEIVVEDDCEPIPEVEYRVLTGEWAMDDIYHTSGLGLWLVFWVVDLSGGEVRFQQTRPRGNTVRVRLATEEQSLRSNAAGSRVSGEIIEPRSSTGSPDASDQIE